MNHTHRKKALAVSCITALVVSGTGIFPLNGLAAAQEGGVVINEVCAKNTEYAAGDGNFYDYIELYNSSSAAADLSGYGLTDDETKPGRFVFPEGTILEAGKHMIVFCNSKEFSLNGQFAAQFGLSTDGETVILTDKSGNTADTVTFGIIDANVSYGRVTDGSSEFAFMGMTPNEKNKTDSVIKKDVKAPVLSVESGFYSSSFDLSISSAEGTKIYYTLNSSTPNASSSLYSSAITISSDMKAVSAQKKPGGDPNAGQRPDDNKAPEQGGASGTRAVVVRAAACDSEGNFSEPVTGVYFIGFDNKASYYKTLKIISLVTDSENLYDREKGIYQNYDKEGYEWERPVNMQVLSGGKLQLDQNAGIRIHGGYTRRFEQKSFNIYARDEYGKSKIEYDLFSGNLYSESSGEQIDKFDSFILRNGGNDTQSTRFRDKLNQTLVSDRNFLNQEMEPAIVFLNGEFFGHYEITEKISEDYIKSHCGVSKKDVCIVKNQILDEGDEETYQEYKQLAEWVKSTDFSDSANYEELCSKVDISCFIDYMSAQIFFGNKDWGKNNVACWKVTKTDDSNPYADGRWRFIMFDTEYSANMYGQIPSNKNTFSQVMTDGSFIGNLLSGAMKNQEFRKQFSMTFMDMANYNFASEKINSLISQYSEIYKQPAADTFAKFWGDKNGASTFSSAVSAVKSFYSSRYSSITGYLKSAANLKGSLVSLTVSNDSKCGKVRVNTLSPDMKSGSYTGKYYSDFPVTLTAEPAEGYTFSGWKTSDGKIIKSKSTEITLSGNTTVTALYSQGSVSENDESVTGDINGDGSVNAADLNSLVKYLLGSADLSSSEKSSADMNEDGKINILDYILFRNLL